MSTKNKISKIRAASFFRTFHTFCGNASLSKGLVKPKHFLAKPSFHFESSIPLDWMVIIWTKVFSPAQNKVLTTFPWVVLKLEKIWRLESSKIEGFANYYRQNWSTFSLSKFKKEPKGLNWRGEKVKQKLLVSVSKNVQILALKLFDCKEMRFNFFRTIDSVRM